jgi:hypothetical protein
MAEESEETAGPTTPPPGVIQTLSARKASLQPLNAAAKSCPDDTSAEEPDAHGGSEESGESEGPSTPGVNQSAPPGKALKPLSNAALESSFYDSSEDESRGDSAGPRTRPAAVKQAAPVKRLTVQMQRASPECSSDGTTSEGSRSSEETEESEIHCRQPAGDKPSIPPAKTPASQNRPPRASSSESPGESSSAEEEDEPSQASKPPSKPSVRSRTLPAAMRESSSGDSSDESSEEESSNSEQSGDSPGGLAGKRTHNAKPPGKQQVPGSDNATGSNSLLRAVKTKVERAPAGLPSEETEERGSSPRLARKKGVQDAAPRKGLALESQPNGVHEHGGARSEELEDETDDSLGHPTQVCYVTVSVLSFLCFQPAYWAISRQGWRRRVWGVCLFAEGEL